jgi:hypothetical protein
MTPQIFARLPLREGNRFLSEAVLQCRAATVSPPV